MRGLGIAVVGLVGERDSQIEILHAICYTGSACFGTLIESSEDTGDDTRR